MQGRRIPLDNGKCPILEQAGDYAGPVFGYAGRGIACVFYLLPIARDEGVNPNARSVFHVAVPPHRAIEEPDGSLTLRESIGNPYWHGYLTSGVWELEKSRP